jgi:hypothetical protein
MPRNIFGMNEQITGGDLDLTVVLVCITHQDYSQKLHATPFIFPFMQET